MDIQKLIADNNKRQDEYKARSNNWPKVRILYYEDADGTPHNEIEKTVENGSMFTDLVLAGKKNVQYAFDPEDSFWSTGIVS